MSYVEQARHYLAQREGTATLIEREREKSEISEISPPRREESARTLCERSEIRGKPDDVDDWLREMRASYAPILHVPPAGCLGPRACSRLGPCDRHAAGSPCLVNGAA